MAKWHGGKGDTQRKVDRTKFADNYDKAYPNRKKTKVELALEELDRKLGER